MTFETIPWRLMADLALVVLTATALLALAGLSVMAVAGQVLARTRQRSSYDKCGRQLATLAALLGWLLTLTGAGVVGMRLFSQFSLPRAAESAEPALAVATQTSLASSLTTVSHILTVNAQAQADMLVWLVLVCGTFFVTFYAALWRTLRKSPLLHQFLGLLGIFFCYAALYGVMSVVSADAAFELGEVRAETLRAIFMPAETSTLWNGLSYLLPLTLGMGGGLGALWLILRRHRDDYGRDHYTQMLPWCAVWARNGWGLLWILLAAFTGINLWHASQGGGPLTLNELSRDGARLLLWLIPGLLWAMVARSATPLRHKLTLLLALLLGMGFVIPVYMGLISKF